MKKNQKREDGSVDEYRTRNKEQGMMNVEK